MEVAVNDLPAVELIRTACSLACAGGIDSALRKSAEAFLLDRFKSFETEECPEGMEPFGEVNIDFGQFAQKINEVQTVAAGTHKEGNFIEVCKSQVLLDLLAECAIP